MPFGPPNNNLIAALFQRFMQQSQAPRDASVPDTMDPQFGLGMPETLPAPSVSRDVTSHEARSRMGAGALPPAPAPGLDFPSRPDTMVPLTDSPYKQPGYGVVTTESFRAPAGLMSPSHVPNAPVSAAPAVGKELPFQTYQRLTGQKWGGGGSQDVLDLLSKFGIDAAPGSSEANSALQRALIANAANVR